MKYTVFYTIKGQDCEEQVSNAEERDALIEELSNHRFGKYKNIHYCGTTQYEYENRNN